MNSGNQRISEELSELIQCPSAWKPDGNAPMPRARLVVPAGAGAHNWQAGETSNGGARLVFHQSEGSGPCTPNSNIQSIKAARYKTCSAIRTSWGVQNVQGKS